MKSFYTLLTGALLTAGPALAQPAAPTPVQSIALKPNTALCGAVQLANHNTVLLIGSLEGPEVVLHCLAPDGRTLWQTPVERMQSARRRGQYDWGRLMADLGSNSAKQEEIRKTLEVAAQLRPLRVYSSGNTVFTAEYLTQEAYDKLPKDMARRLEAGQLWLQRIDEQGQVTQATFLPTHEEKRKTTVDYLCNFADGADYYEVSREVNRREETTRFFADRYDMLGKQRTRVELALPAPPPAPGGLSGLGGWYQHWFYLGHRPGQVYFARRVLTTDATQKPGRQPQALEVAVLGPDGQRLSGFTTTFDLPTGGVGYAGTAGGDVEQTHIPDYITRGRTIFDGWDLSAGGMGSLLLDYATGEVYVAGEVGPHALPETNNGLYPSLKGFYARRYAPDGKLLGRLDYPYGDELRKATGLGFGSTMARTPSLWRDPLTGQLTYWFRDIQGMAQERGRLDLLVEPDLKAARYRYDGTTAAGARKLVFTNVIATSPVWLSRAGALNHQQLSYLHAAPTDAPVYAALEKLRAQRGAEAPGYQFYLTGTAPGKALVVECPQLTGGTLQVYTF